MLATMGSVYAVHSRMTMAGLDTRRFRCMVSYPTVYDTDGLPHESADYLNLVFLNDGDHWGPFDVMDHLREYGPSSSRWLFDFYREVGASVSNAPATA